MSTLEITRRGWLAGVLATAAGSTLRGDEPVDETRELEDVEARAKKAGLGPFRSVRTTHYQAVGDAPEPFRKKALEICEGLAKDYLAHFQDKGFKVKSPGRRLTIVTLSSAEAFSAFLGKREDQGVGGLYDLETNALLVYDNREGGQAAGAVAERANTITLTHEATHQLTFNTGLLNREGDVPLAISEGLAMYCEDRGPDGKPKIGEINALWLPAFHPDPRTTTIVPADQLLVGDALFDDPKARNLARATGWLLVYHLLKHKARVPDMRKYLAAIHDRRDASHRLEDAQTYLGDLKKLDRELKGTLRTFTTR